MIFDQFCPDLTFRLFMKIAYVYTKGRLNRLKDINNGECPSEFFYGAIELEKRKHQIGKFEIDVNYAPGIFGGCINILAEYNKMPEKMTGGALSQVYDLLEELNKYDVVVGSTSGIAFALSFWRIINRLSSPIIAIHCGLLNHSYPWFRRRLTSILLSNMYTVLFGEGEYVELLRLFPTIKKNIFVNQFGVDNKFWIPDTSFKDNYILSVGNDGRRDFESLIEAAKFLPMEVKILTSRKISGSIPKNVTIINGSWHKELVSDSDLRRLYQKAQCVVVSLQESQQPSGQSVTLQAMSCGCPVILTRTQGLWSNDMMRDLYNVLFTRPGEPSDIVDCVQKIINDEILRNRLSMNGRKTIEETATSTVFAQTIEKLCQSSV